MASTTRTTTTTTTYNIKQWLRAVEKLLAADPNPKNVRFIRRVLQEWRQLLQGISLDEGRVVEFLALDNDAMHEASIEESPLYEIRSVEQYLCWEALEAYTQNLYQQRFFDLCIEH